MNNTDLLALLHVHGSILRLAMYLPVPPVLFDAKIVTHPVAP